MIEEYLLDYGPLGLFVIYLIYDRQVILKKVIDALDRISEKLK